ncbi:MAG: RNA methyltransferase [Clostridia bacterium]|nr:RNA methyltransferase [Clostridia bacterium]
MDNLISSKDNSNIKHVKKLISSSKFRAETKSFVIEGVRMSEEALKNKSKILKAFYTQKCAEKNPKLIAEIENNAKQTFLVSENLIKAISDAKTPQGMVLVCEQKSQNEMIKDLGANIILLENIQNPSNLGSIFRVCDALGVKDIFILGDSCDIYNPKVLRGSMGSIFRLNLFLEENSLGCIKNLKNLGYKIYATVPKDDATHLDKTEFLGKCGIIFGNEGNGIKEETIKVCDGNITIPMNKETESLNVSVAAGIVIWEMIKRGNK